LVEEAEDRKVDFKKQISIFSTYFLSFKFQNYILSLISPPHLNKG